MFSAVHQQLTRKRVVISGMGTLNPLGFDVAQTRDNLFSGKSTARPIGLFDASSFRARYACQVDDSYKNAYANSLSKCNSSRREVQFGFIAAEEALRSAQVTDLSTVGALIIGSGMSTDDFDWIADVASGRSEEVGAKPFGQHPAELGNLITKHMFPHINPRTVHTACASSAQAIAEGFDLIASGEVEVAMVGGADCMIEPIQLAGLSLLGALSTNHDEASAAYKPFDSRRDGFLFGEGAAMLVLESLEHAIGRSAPILCEIIGYGMTQSAYRITDINENGTGPREAILGAIEDARVSGSDIGYVNAHGTGTKANDFVEAKVLKETCPGAFVSSSKSMTGHMIAAAGAMEACLSIMCLESQMLPPTINVESQDPACDVQLTPSRLTSHAYDIALSNSIGFGGTNVSLLFRRWTHGS